MAGESPSLDDRLEAALQASAAQLAAILAAAVYELSMELGARQQQRGQLAKQGCR